MITQRWFFIRGLVREAAHWDELPRLFRERFPSAEVHCLDAPGNGRRYREVSPLTTAANVTALRARFDEIVGNDPGPPSYLLAVSFGGMIAVDWIFRHPSDLAGAVLVNTSLSGVSPLLERLLPTAWPTLARVFAERDPFQRERLILTMTTSLREPSRLDALAARRAAIYERRPVARVNAVRQLVAAASFRVPQGQPAVPVLVLNSLGDRLVSPECSAALARRWSAPIERHPSAGHDLPLEAPDWCVEAIARWLYR